MILVVFNGAIKSQAPLLKPFVSADEELMAGEVCIMADFWHDELKIAQQCEPHCGNQIMRELSDKVALKETAFWKQFLQSGRGMKYNKGFADLKTIKERIDMEYYECLFILATMILSIWVALVV